MPINWYWEWLKLSDIEKDIKEIEAQISNALQEWYLSKYKTLINSVKTTIFDTLLQNTPFEKNKEDINELIKTFEKLIKYTNLLKQKNNFLKINNNNLYQNIKDDKISFEEKIQLLEKENSDKNNEILELQNTISWLNKDLFRVSQKILDIEKLKKIDENEINRLSKNLELYTKTIEEKNKEISKIFFSKYPSDVNKNYNLYELLENLEKSNRQEKLIIKLSDENLILKSKIEELDKYNQNLNNHFYEYEKNIHKLSDDNRILKEKIAELEKENTSLKSKTENTNNDYIWTDAEWLVKLVEQFYQDK